MKVIGIKILKELLSLCLIISKAVVKGEAYTAQRTTKPLIPKHYLETLKYNTFLNYFIK